VSGQFDVALLGGHDQRSRAQQLYFSMPIAEATHYYMKRKATGPHQSIKDLSGTHGGYAAGQLDPPAEPEVDALLQKTGGKLGKVSLYASYPEAYQDLRTDHRLRAQQRSGNLRCHPQASPNDFRAGTGRVRLVTMPGQ